MWDPRARAEGGASTLAARRRRPRRRSRGRVGQRSTALAAWVGARGSPAAAAARAASRPASTPTPPTSASSSSAAAAIVVASACNGQGFQFAPETGAAGGEPRARGRRGAGARRRRAGETTTSDSSTSASRSATARSTSRGARAAGAGGALRHSALRHLRGSAAPQRAALSGGVRGRAGRAGSSSCRRSRPTPRSPCAASSPRRGPAATSSARASSRPRCGPGPTPADLAERPDEGRRAARARDPRRGPDHPRQPRRARAHGRGRGAARHPRRGSAFACAPTSSATTSPRRCRPTGVSVRDAIQRYKAGIPTEDLLAISEDEIRDPYLDLAGIHLHLGRHSADPAIWRAAIDSLAELLVAPAARLGRLDSARARPRRRLPRPARSVRAGAAAARRRSAPLAGHRRLRGGDLRPPRPRGSSGSGHRPSRGAARDRARPGALRRRRHPPGDGGQREAPDGADPADLGGDRLLRRLPAGREPRVQPLDLPSGRERRRPGRPHWSPTSPGAPARST